MAGFLESTSQIDKIAKHRLRVSMMAMKELSAFWPVCNWIFQLFTKIIKESSKGTQRRVSPTNINPESATDGGENLGLQVEDNYGNNPIGTWAEIEEFTSAWGVEDGFEFDFSHTFAGVPDGLVNFGADTPGTGTSANGFPRFLAN
jgi:hypothetical protein